ncbi:8751_t:CDS:1 [Funneliformis geosporum]|uniref:11958_t:CDS:1 n=1 Tax=Funneliformis geosporum TaxID=1117311 RepID=A0A9W4WRB2_9GLOM|nr:8751_t:CDS:1 [Funneliformis geosporum]CAI2173099.1 11958_t:CDS:1 [Funneliformis geosporum]
MSQPGIFTKSNLVYIPLSVTIAHISQFIFNSPLSVWKEFPPNVPTSVYSSIFFTPFLLFLSLSFEPIQTRIRFYTLLSLALIFVSIPISFRGKYPTLLHNFFVSYGSMYGLKMLLFLKFNRVYLNQEDHNKKKEFKSFLWTLFNSRFNSYIIPPKKDGSNEKENSLIITSPTTSQIYKKIINRIIISFAKLLLLELVMFNAITYTSSIPEKPYQLRLIEFFTKGIPAITMPLMLQNLHLFLCLYLMMSVYSYDILIIISTIFYRLFLHSSSKANNYKPILIKCGLLTPSEFVSLKEWMITTIFNTKHLFSEPWMASSPRDFWSARWQVMINESFKELGYLPIKNTFAPIVPKKIANTMGVFGAFGVSALLHEHLIIGNFDIWTGEHLFFFMMHGVIFVLWEAIFGRENKNENLKVKRFLKCLLLLVINLSVLPAFIEPLRRRPDLFQIPLYLAKYYQLN